MSAQFPRITEACDAATEARKMAEAAKTRLDRTRADNAGRRADEMAVAAYAEELLPALFGGSFYLSRRHARFPAAVLTRRSRYVYHVTGSALFDHPLVFREAGSRGPDGPANTIIIGRPYPVVVDGEMSSAARDDAAQLAALGWGIWWRSDLSTHYPGWTQLVLAKHGLQACGVAEGFIPLASPDLGVSAWDEWKSLPAEYLREHLPRDQV